MPRWSFYRHMPVYLQNGRRLGRTEEIGHALDYIHVRQGNLLIRDWYIPVKAIVTTSEQGIRLSVSRDDLHRNRWNAPPESFLVTQGATPGYEYTSGADVSRRAATADRSGSGGV